MSLEQAFLQAQADSKNLSQRPDNMTLLKIYALFKQGSQGDVSGERPGMTDFVGRAKYDAWANLKGSEPKTAMQQYIDLIESLKQNWAFNHVLPLESMHIICFFPAFTPIYRSQREICGISITFHFPEVRHFFSHLFILFQAISRESY